MIKPCLWSVLLLLVLARAAVAQSVPDMDTLMQWQDGMVLRQYSVSYPMDHRYDDVLHRVQAHLNNHLSEVYHDYHKQVAYYVFRSRLGFNAETWDRLIVFDSLLLDVLHNLCEAIVVRGGVDNEYVQTLALATAQKSAAAQAGAPDNPYRLPAIWGETPQQRQQIEALFEETMAAWMAHEGSHAFLNHCRARAQAQRLAALYYRRRQTAGDDVRSQLTYGMDADREREADECGVRLILRCGYHIDGFIYSLQFAQMMERASGNETAFFRTHPPPADRILLARQVAEQEKK